MTTTEGFEDPSAHRDNHFVARNMGSNSTPAVTGPAEYEFDESNTTSFYVRLFERFTEQLLRVSPVETRAITESIKHFFAECFSHKYAVHLSGPKMRGEFLTDVLVTTFPPKNVLSQDRKFTCTVPEFRAILAVESEIGGPSASSAGPLMANVVEDYLKLLFIRSRFRVMVFTSLAYEEEDGDHVLNRVQTMREIYSRTEKITGGVLLIHLTGANNRGTSGQVKVDIRPGNIRGFIISPDGESVVEI